MFFFNVLNPLNIAMEKIEMPSLRQAGEWYCEDGYGGTPQAVEGNCSEDRAEKAVQSNLLLLKHKNLVLFFLVFFLALLRYLLGIFVYFFSRLMQILENVTVFTGKMNVFPWDFNNNTRVLYVETYLSDLLETNPWGAMGTNKTSFDCFGSKLV